MIKEYVVPLINHMSLTYLVFRIGFYTFDSSGNTIFMFLFPQLIPSQDLEAIVNDIFGLYLVQHSIIAVAFDCPWLQTLFFISMCVRSILHIAYGYANLCYIIVFLYRWLSFSNGVLISIK